ncbi:hypothetical protein MATL_G00152610 [Megalops atlanticus]|uniref:PDZ domain-containing protein n=1 Tax=Megalops atlanticus TaxID=7932 RepID=A0A9D3T362_MEGAT|nr:hypothetical protein MATL_G00152610 [Megalops atlanticus]
MKVTVTFGRTGVVVPCKEGWTVRDLIQQATQRYKKILEQEGDFVVRTHHVEYCDGGILDPDDVLTDLVEDRDKLIAVYEEQEAQQRATVSPGGSSVTGRPSPDPYDSELSVFQPIRGGEIEVNSSALKSNTPLLVRSSSDSALSPPFETGSPQPEDGSGRPTPTGVAHALADRGGADDRTRGDAPAAKMSHITLNKLTRTVDISGEHGPLGIHVVPYCSSLSGRSLGLHIRGVEENSRSKKEGIFQEDECIVKINDTELMDKSFVQSQEVFRQAMCSPSVRLEVLPVHNKDRYEKSLIGQLFNLEGPDGAPKVKVPPPVKAKPEVKRADSGARPAEPAARPGDAQGAPHPSGLAAAPPRAESDSPIPRKSPALPPIVSLAGKGKGRRLRIDLKKGPEGLGFTVVTRDASVHGPGPILVKNILPRGAAVKDGRLQSGDRILEVNGADITGRTQEELVAMLRSTKQGETVSLVVARQEELFLPRELKGEEAGLQLSEEGKEQLMFEVPLNDSGSAGLGVSLKGNKSRETGADLGIFIKSIIHGGAAYKDGRLRVNDQLIAVNGESLLAKSNHDAMETLRRSMSMEGNLRGMIQLVVVRVMDRSGKENQETVNTPKQASDTPLMHPPTTSKSNGPAQPPMVSNIIYEKAGAFSVTNGSHGDAHEEDDDDEEDLPPLPPRLAEDMDSGPRHLYSNHSPELESGSLPVEPVPQRVPLHHHVKSSKSMDLEENHGKELGPTLGLVKSSSLESLQTALSEAGKSQLPFHRPRAPMGRGRGCNESFRAAIDKSYDGPPELDDDDLSDPSSGRDTPASGSSRQGMGDAEESKRDKKKKAKGKKKEKQKGKGKDKDKKKVEETEKQDKKAPKKGFGLLRFGKKKDEKVKVEAKASLQRQKSEVLSEEELEKMKEERERIEAKHQELRERQARDHLPDVEDDDMDPNYARINNFRNPSPPTRPLQDPHAVPPAPPSPRLSQPRAVHGGAQ